MISLKQSVANSPCCHVQELVNEVCKQIQMFKPDPRHIKQRIENAIGQRFIKRRDEESHTSPYVYVTVFIIRAYEIILIFFCCLILFNRYNPE